MVIVSLQIQLALTLDCDSRAGDAFAQEWKAASRAYRSRTFHGSA
jgi:hypothetical protein